MIVHSKMSILDTDRCKCRDVLVKTRHSSFDQYLDHDVEGDGEPLGLRNLDLELNERIDGIDQYFLDIVLCLALCCHRWTCPSLCFRSCLISCKSQEL